MVQATRTDIDNMQIGYRYLDQDGTLRYVSESNLPYVDRTISNSVGIGAVGGIVSGTAAGFFIAGAFWPVTLAVAGGCVVVGVAYKMHKRAEAAKRPRVHVSIGSTRHAGNPFRMVP